MTAKPSSSRRKRADADSASSRDEVADAISPQPDNPSPNDGRIKPGEIRNPNGRRGKPRPKVNFFDEEIELVIAGKRTKLTRAEVIMRALFQLVTSGNVSAARELRHWPKIAGQIGPDETGDDQVSAADTAALDRYLERVLNERASEETKPNPEPSNDGA